MCSECGCYSDWRDDLIEEAWDDEDDRLPSEIENERGE